MEVPRLGVQLELLLPPYTTATATPTWDLSLVFHLQHSSLQCQILNPLREARDRTYVLMDTSQIAPHPRWMPLITWSSQAKDQIRAEDLSTSCGNARSPTHCAGLGIKPVSWYSLGAAALLVVSSGWNPLLTGSPSWASRIGRAKAFCAQAPAMPPEPARPLSAEAPLHRLPKTSFWELHPPKGNSLRAANHRPNAPRIRKAKQAVFTPGPNAAWLRIPALA